MEIEIQRRALVGWLTALLLAVLALIGYFASPHAEDGQPVLLLPDVRAIELYRREASTWATEWHEIDQTLIGVLEAQRATLLDQSRTAQDAFGSAVALARRVESTEAPAALLGLHDQALTVAAAQVDASTAVNRWLSGPSAENQEAAQAAIRQARAGLAAFTTNQWLDGSLPAPTQTEAPR